MASSMDFAFGSLVIGVLFRDLVVDGALFDKTGSCYLMLYPNDMSVLGGPFLKSTYSIYDWDDQDIYVARGASCGEDIMATGVGEGSVANATGNCRPAPFRIREAKA